MSLSSHQPHNLMPLKDLVIFEERIRQNLLNLRLLRRKLRWRIALLSFACLLILIAHARFVEFSSIFDGFSVFKILGLLLLYTLLVADVILLVSAIRSFRNSLVKRYEEQCEKTLRHFNLHLASSPTAGKEKELAFAKRLPRKLADLIEAYRIEYRARRALHSKLTPAQSKKIK